MNGQIYSDNGQAMREKLIRLFEDDPIEQELIPDMSSRELFQTWLEWEGIIGYTDDIIRALRESGYVVEVPEED